jgi:hypothetical protein
METASVCTIKLEGLACGCDSSKKSAMFTSSGTNSSTSRRGNFMRSPQSGHANVSPDAQPPTDANPDRLTREATADLLVKITSRFQESAADALKKSKSPTKIGKRTTYARRHKRLSLFAACTGLTYSNMLDGSGVVLEKALDNFTQGCCTGAPRTEAAAEIEQLQRAVFPGILFGKDQSRNSIILPADSKYPEKYFGEVEHGEFSCTCPLNDVADLSAEYRNTLRGSSMPPTAVDSLKCDANQIGETKVAMEDALLHATWDSNALEIIAMTNVHDNKVPSGTGDTERKTETTGDDEQQKAPTDLWDMPLSKTGATESQGVSKSVREWWEE